MRPVVEESAVGQPPDEVVGCRGRMPPLGPLDDRHLVEDRRIRRVVHHEQGADARVLLDRGQVERADEAERGRMPLAPEPPLPRHPLGDRSDGAVHA